MRRAASTDEGGYDVRAQWLVRMRWGALIGQVLIVLVARPAFGIDLPVGLLLAILGTLAASNVALAWTLRTHRRLSDTWCAVILAFDTLELTAMLFISGGTSNPFSVFYLVQISIAAVTLGSRWTWLLAVLGVSSYAALFLLPTTAAADSATHAAQRFAQHLEAMWIALTLSAALTAYFVTRLTTLLAKRDREIAGMREIATRHERLAALTTLAAGAAHELGTPLATVAVAAGELERAIATLAPAQASVLGSDVQLIRSEIRRCRKILDGMAAESGGVAGEMPTAFPAADIVRDVLTYLSVEDKARVEMDRLESTVVFLPRRAVVRAVLSLVRNGLYASAAPNMVAVTIETTTRLRISVRDSGVGMAADVLSRLGEPFFTTKPPGQGLGLGLFLVRNLADQLGGHLRIESTPAVGTTAILELPTRIEVDVDRA
jgi:two-component system, sensor histidine kinase RegB